MIIVADPEPDAYELRIRDMLDKSTVLCANRTTAVYPEGRRFEPLVQNLRMRAEALTGYVEPAMHGYAKLELHCDHCGRVFPLDPPHESREIRRAAIVGGVVLQLPIHLPPKL